MDTRSSPTRRVGVFLSLLALAACGGVDTQSLSDDAADGGSTGQSAAALDLSEMARFNAGELPDLMVSVVTPDGESEPMAFRDMLAEGEVLYASPDSVVDGAFIANVPLDAAADGTPPDFSEENDASEALCACTYTRDYSVVAGTHQVWVCLETTSPWEPFCWSTTVLLYDEITCRNYCVACGTEVCQNQDGQYVSRPNVSPTAEHWSSCNPYNPCGDDEDDGGILGDGAGDY